VNLSAILTVVLISKNSAEGLRVQRLRTTLMTLNGLENTFDLYIQKPAVAGLLVSDHLPC
jgi:hypothetical protein